MDIADRVRKEAADIRDQLPVVVISFYKEHKTKEHVRNFIQCQLGTYEPPLSISLVNLFKIVAWPRKNCNKNYLCWKFLLKVTPNNISKR